MYLYKTDSFFFTLINTKIFFFKKKSLISSTNVGKMDSPSLLSPSQSHFHRHEAEDQLNIWKNHSCTINVVIGGSSKQLPVVVKIRHVGAVN